MNDLVPMKPQVPTRNIVWVLVIWVLYAVYLISPVDFIPDFLWPVFGLGYFDDAGLLLLAVKKTVELLRRKEP